MTDISNLKKTIIDRISNTITTVQDVSNYEKTGFTGFPAVNVISSGNENDFWTNAENQRQFTFLVRIYQQISANAQLEAVSDEEKKLAEAIMERVVSEMIDSFDQFYNFNGEADFMRAVPSVWGYVNTSNGWCRTAEIKLQVVKSFEVL